MIFETNMYRNRTQQLYYLKVQQSKVYEKNYFILATVLSLLYSCTSKSPFEGAWLKTIGNQTLYIYEINGLVGYQIQDTDDNPIESGLLVFVNDSVFNIHNRSGIIIAISCNSL